MSDLLLLTADELRLLSELIYYQELDAYRGMIFHSIDDSNKYLDDCNNTYENVIAVLKSAEDADTKYATDETKSTIAHQMFQYVLATLSSSFQIMVNYSVRAKHVQKLFEHANSLLEQLEKLDADDVDEVERLSNEVTQFEQAMTKFLDKYKSKITEAFSQWLESTGMSFEELVASYKSKLGYEGAFSELEDIEKINVYDDILKDSGVGNIFKMEAKEIVSSELLILCAGVMVWDIFTAEKKLETASRDAGEALSNIGGAILDGVIETFVKSALIDTPAEVVAGYVAVGVGFLASFVGAFIIGAAAAALLDVIFASGGSEPLKTDTIRCYALQIPDPVAQAREIRYDSEHKKHALSSTV